MFFTPLLQGAAALAQTQAAGVHPLKTPWTRQPQASAQIDWSNPITRGLKTALMPRFEHVKRLVPLRTGTLQFGPTPSGIAVKATAASGLVYSTTSGVADTVTILYAGNIARSGNTNVAAGISGTGGNFIIGFQFANPGTNRAIIRQTSGGAPTTRDFSNGNSIAQRAVVAAVVSGNSTVDVYWNGVINNGTLVTGSTGTNDNFNTVGLGGVQRAINAYADSGQDGVLFCYWNRALSASEIAQISANPWQLFKPTRRLLGTATAVSSATISRPGSDIVAAGWSASTGPDLYAMIDETVADDADYIVSPDVTATPGPATFGSTISLPAGSYAISIRARRTAAVGEVRVLMKDAGGVTAGTSAWQALGSAFTTYSLPVITTGTATQLSIEVQS